MAKRSSSGNGSTTKKHDKPTRPFVQGAVPLVDVEGTSFECGFQLGYFWAEAIRLGAKNAAPDSKPWWKDKRYTKLIDRYAPHLPDVYRGMAKSSGVIEDLISTRVRVPKPAAAVTGKSGCTSFCLAPQATLDGTPISGQTKDTGCNRWFQFQVLRMKISDAPSVLTLTYPGWLFGHGFVKGRCVLFRNSLWAGHQEGGLPFAAWGLLALHCKSVDDAVELTQKHGVVASGHSSISDEHGDIAGLEFTQNGLGIMRPQKGIYTHANCVNYSKKLQEFEACPSSFTRANSIQRQDRLRELFEPDNGRLTAQLAMQAMSDHQNYPHSLCRHDGLDALTTSAVVVEPSKGLLHCTRGNPCQNWATTYSL